MFITVFPMDPFHKHWLLLDISHALRCTLINQSSCLKLIESTIANDCWKCTYVDSTVTEFTGAIGADKYEINWSAIKC